MDIKSSKEGNMSFFKFNHGPDVGSEITHSSALFLVFESELKQIQTELNFLNYWKIKRDVKSLKGNLTIRQMDGVIICKDSFIINELKAYSIKIRPFLVAKNLKEFTGTVEIEFFSESNLFIPYPAVIVRYFSEKWHTGMHSTARYFYQDSGDSPERIENKQHALEANITLFYEEDVTNSIVIHNGSNSNTCDEIIITVTNILGETTETKLKKIHFAAYESKIINIDYHIDYKKFLRGKRGMLTINYSNVGLFPRIMFINEHTSGSLSVEHSNFGLTSNAELDCTPISEKSKNLIYSFPVLPSTFKTEIDIFPTFPMLQYPYVLKLTASSFSGEKLNEKQFILDNDHGTFIQHAFEPKDYPQNIQIDYQNEEKLPNRFHTAINYSTDKFTLPAIVLDGPLPKGARPIGTRWAPFFIDESDATSFIFICSRKFEDTDKTKTKTKIIFNIYVDHISKELTFEKEINADESLDINVGKILEENGCVSKYGWIYMTFSPPTKHTVYFVSKKSSGGVMAGHAF
jgi:hypothetical protein